MTGRTSPNSFEVIPLMVYRIYPDGHEELVRGVDLIGTALTTFNKILAADNRSEAFNGMCGAESGFVPVSAGGPGLLFSEVEVQKKPKSQELSPILGPPFDDK
jgi:predicted Zn-dependent protease